MCPDSAFGAAGVSGADGTQYRDETLRILTASGLGALSGNNGKENGNYYSVVVYRVYMGMMEKKMETTMGLLV